jgi:hypothetical protein
LHTELTVGPEAPCCPAASRRPDKCSEEDAGQIIAKKMATGSTRADGLPWRTILRLQIVREFELGI